MHDYNIYNVHFEIKMYDQRSEIILRLNIQINAYLYLYIYFACLSVRLYPINVKTAEPIGPTFFCVTSHNPQERFIDDQNLKKLPRTKFDFHKIHDFF